MTVDNFDPTGILKILAGHGVTKTDAAATEPLKAWVRVRREDTGGAKEGTPELYFADPTASSCSFRTQPTAEARAAWASACLAKPEPRHARVARGGGTQPFRHHGSNPQRSRDFYQALFGLPDSGVSGSDSRARRGRRPSVPDVRGRSFGQAPTSDTAASPWTASILTRF